MSLLAPLFLLGALDGYSKAEAVEFSSSPEVLPELEQLVLHRLFEMDKKVRGCIEDYEFTKLAKALHDFCNDDLSAFYFDIRKDSLYCDAPDSDRRRACRSVMAQVFSCLSAWLAPILCFTAEEAWSHRPEGVFEDAESIHLREFPQVPDGWKNDALADKWEKVKVFRSIIFENLERMRKEQLIGSSLEANIKIDLHEEHADQLKDIDWAELCIVSQAEAKFIKAPELEGMALSWNSQKAPGEKCERCWQVLPEVAENGDLCNRCTDAVKRVKKAA